MADTDDMAASEGSTPEERSGAGNTRSLLIGGAVGAAAGLLALLLVDPILGAFLLIMGVTLMVISLLARDWDQHSTYEERELARAKKRKEKWERGSAARERDRVRWEAHQARQARKTGQ
jgi:hypothetical protein